MTTIRVTSSEFEKEYERYAEIARCKPVTITSDGRSDLVVLDAEQYERLRRLDDRVAMPVEALSEDELDKLEYSSKIYKEAEHKR